MTTIDGLSLFLNRDQPIVETIDNVIVDNNESMRLINWFSKLQIDYNPDGEKCMIIMGDGSNGKTKLIQQIANHLNTVKRNYNNNTLIPPDIQLVWFTEEYPFVWTLEKINMIRYLNRYSGLGMIFEVNATDLTIPEELRRIAYVIHATRKFEITNI